MPPHYSKQSMFAISKNLSHENFMKESTANEYRWKNSGTESDGFDDLKNYLSKNTMQVASAECTKSFIKELNMCAAIWGVMYEAEREFDTTWLELESPVSGLCLIDAAEDGAYSMYAEGLIVKSLFGSAVIIPMDALPFTEKVSGVWGMTLTRESIVLDVTQDDWTNLLAIFEKRFSQGMHSSDLRFIRQAIDWLRNGGELKGGVCSKLKPEYDT